MKKFAIIKDGLIVHTFTPLKEFGIDENPYPKEINVVELPAVIQDRVSIGEKLLDISEYYNPNEDFQRLIIAFTNRCNLRCPHCYNNHINADNPQKNEELTVDDMKAIIDKCTPAFYLEMIGGECTLRFDDMIEIANYALDKIKGEIIIKTNATLDVDWSRLPSRDKIRFEVSIDGLEKEHDAIRGNGSFTKTITNIKKMTEAGFTKITAFGTFDRSVFDNNLEYVQSFIKFCETEIKPDAVATNILLPFDKLEDNYDRLKRVETHMRVKPLLKSSINHRIKCFGGCQQMHFVYFRADGKIGLRCPLSRYSFGNHTTFDKKKYFEIEKVADELGIDCYTVDFTALTQYIDFLNGDKNRGFGLDKRTVTLNRYTK